MKIGIQGAIGSFSEQASKKFIENHGIKKPEIKRINNFFLSLRIFLKILHLEKKKVVTINTKAVQIDLLHK